MFTQEAPADYDCDCDLDDDDGAALEPDEISSFYASKGLAVASIREQDDTRSSMNRSASDDGIISSLPGGHLGACNHSADDRSEREKVFACSLELMPASIEMFVSSTTTTTTTTMDGPGRMFVCVPSVGRL